MKSKFKVDDIITFLHSKSNKKYIIILIADHNGTNLFKLLEYPVINREYVFLYESDDMINVINTDVLNNIPLPSEENKNSDYFIKKQDNGKIRIGLLFSDFAKAINEIAKVVTFGANKYSDHEWTQVENKEKRYKDALARHIIAYFDEPSSLDDESKFLHLAHAGWNVLALLQIELMNEDNKQVEDELMAAYENELRK